MGWGATAKSTVAARLLERLPGYQPLVVYRQVDDVTPDKLAGPAVPVAHRPRHFERPSAPHAEAGPLFEGWPEPPRPEVFALCWMTLKPTWKPIPPVSRC